ncbi:MAG: metallophosphoesterase [Alphaproteobacteria bacterium]|nr:MAG: metallophosphoesterase [Alphaproteobacteria bacterium]
MRFLGLSSLLRPEDSVALHQASRAYIEARLKEQFDGPVVVVTHYAPSVGSIEKRFEHDPLSPCFASRLDELIGASNVDLWVHGHTHTTFDYMIKRTRVVCNAVGYRDRSGGKVPERENAFRPDLVVEI